MKRKRFLLMEMLKNSNKTRKVFLLLAAVVMCFCMTNEAMAQEVASGTTGECTWAITGTSDNYTLTISGNGTMGNSSSTSDPWYSYQTGIKTVDIQQGVTAIGDYAFYGCSGLTSVEIPNSVTSIGDYAFAYCAGLTSVMIPHSVTLIGRRVFQYCSGLTLVTVPNSVTSIGNEAFFGCSSLTSITVDASNPNYSSINGVLFNKLQDILIQYPAGKAGNYTIPNSVTSINSYAFSYCSNLISVEIPNSVTYIGELAFYVCTGLTSVTIGNSVTSIERGAFSRCTGLTSVTIPNSVMSIGTEAFYGCSSLTSITVDASNPAYTSENGVLFSKAKTTLMQYPIGKTDANYTIPNSVTYIGSSAFERCTGLTSVEIPNSVTYIGSFAFENCSNLISVSNLNPTPQSIDSYTFGNIAINNITLYVPAESVEAYQAANVWADFGTITAYMPLAINTPSAANAIRIYPNPVTESFRIDGLTAPTPVTVTDVSGRTVLQQTVEGDESIFVGHLPQGIYLVRVNGKTVKIIKSF
jgi:hypothetical protein